MSDLEARLSGRSFFRVQRSFLIPLGAIRRLSYDEVTLANGKSIRIGRGKHAALKEALDKWSQI